MMGDVRAAGGHGAARRGSRARPMSKLRLAGRTGSRLGGTCQSPVEPASALDVLLLPRPPQLVLRHLLLRRQLLLLRQRRLLMLRRRRQRWRRLLLRLLACCCTLLLQCKSR
jgi:hypothetical protein